MGRGSRGGARALLGEPESVPDLLCDLRQITFPPWTLVLPGKEEALSWEASVLCAEQGALFLCLGGLCSLLGKSGITIAPL